jgi:hypothetical protein
MSDGYVVDAKKVASGGYFHLLRAPFGTAVAKEHRLNARFCLASWRVRSRRHIGRCLHGGSGGKEGGENQCNMLITHCALDSYSFIGIN